MSWAELMTRVRRVAITTGAAAVIVASMPACASAGAQDKPVRITDMSVASSARGLVDIATAKRVALHDAGQVFPVEWSPLATVTRDGTALLYNSIDDRQRTSIRARDLQSGRDAVFAANAMSFAVAPDGRVAFVQETGPVTGEEPTTGTVEVRAPGSTVTETWSAKPADDIVVAWAGTHLVVRRTIAGTEAADIVVLDRPGVERVVGRSSEALAVSPDGRFMLLGATADDGPFSLHVVDVASGGEVADPVTSGPDGELLPTISAEWRGETIVLGGSVSNGNVPALLTFSVSRQGDRLALRLDATLTMSVDHAKVPHDVWGSDDGDAFSALADPPLEAKGDSAPKPSARVLVTCRRSTNACTYREVALRTDALSGRVRDMSRPGPAHA